MLWHRQAIFKSKGDKLCSSAESRIWTRDPRHLIASRLNARWQTDWAIEDQAKTWTRQPVPMISEHSAHLTPLSVDFRTWLWRYTYLLLLISMLWHRQATYIHTYTHTHTHTHNIYIYICSIFMLFCPLLVSQTIRYLDDQLACQLTETTQKVVGTSNFTGKRVFG